MTKKTYTAPEAEIEKFYLVTDVITTSDGDLDNTGGEFNGGADDWEF